MLDCQNSSLSKTRLCCCCYCYCSVADHTIKDPKETQDRREKQRKITYRRKAAAGAGMVELRAGSNGTNSKIEFVLACKSKREVNKGAEIFTFSIRCAALGPTVSRKLGFSTFTSNILHP